MIKVYYSKVSPFLEEDTFFSQLAKIPADRKEKILRMKNKEARMRSLTAGMLLQYALCEKTGLDYETAEPFQIAMERKESLIRPGSFRFTSVCPTRGIMCAAP